MKIYELGVTSNYTFLTGASHPEELVNDAIKKGYSGIAITDECSFSGIVKAHVEARKNQSFKLIIGSFFKVTTDDEKGLINLTLLCPNKKAYQQVSTLITRARRRSEKGSYRVKESDLSNFLDHPLAIWHWTDNEVNNYQQLKFLKHCFGERLWIAFTRLKLSDDYSRYLQIVELSNNFNIPVIAFNKVLMHSSSRLRLQHCLTAIKENKTIQGLGDKLLANAEQHLREIEELVDLYPKELWFEAENLANQCSFSLTDLYYQYPTEAIPPNTSASEYLRKLTYQGANDRWPSGVPDKVKEQLNKELSVIEKLKYENYFLTVYDIVLFARNSKILCQGRGSAANSVVCYCLKITEVSPEKSSLLFERFISEERNEPPDIDVDFEHERREEVIQYIYRKYTREHAALTATLTTYRMRSAIRDVGKALDIAPLLIDKLSRSLAWWDKPEHLLEYFEKLNMSKDAHLIRHYFNLVMSILKFPRHLSQHVGGFVITQAPIATLVPVENAAMPDRTVIQWDKYDIENLGLLKIDVLALGMLTMLRKCMNLITPYHPLNSLESIPHDDERVYKMLSKGDTIGVFQVESRAQMSMLPRLKPKEFYDLVIEIAIVRPGPIQGDMVHPYLKRRDGLEEVTYPNNAIKAVLKRTLGIPIFQEQVIQMAMVAAGFSGGEADQLRRAMATWGRNGDLYKFKDKLVKGMLTNGYSESYANRLFEQMKGFGSYGFPESHSASFAILAYFSAWFKRFHPAGFYCALLNSQPMGFYSSSQLVQDAKHHKINVKPIDVMHSHWACTLEDLPTLEESKTKQPSIRLGLQLVKGFNITAAERILQAREERDFINFQDIVARASLNSQEKESLAKADALPTLTQDRYQAQWQALATETTTPLFSTINHSHLEEEQFVLPSPTQVENMHQDYQRTCLTLRQHPLAILRKKYPVSRCTLARDLKKMKQGQFVRIAGIVTCRQRPGTAAGVLFLTLEDESGNMNIIVWQNTVEKFKQAILASRLLLIKGTIEREQNVVHIVAGHIADISEQLPGFKRASRDFH
ncbi:error-prone DNA polymerase [Pleionea sp. CnH1-48]|uniref:error-prone DNA polymerase n=1 Tax=Pleionea sp. CnH1-48 TaxID=2954494 RepID=UPI0020977E1E|nr:error-prone DNA polymerase [Pleionea sp. CnH1-48]MCO7224969.1 error-prone DNA polymerase [Pleionea sp. CnH1-48]